MCQFPAQRVRGYSARLSRNCLLTALLTLGVLRAAPGAKPIVIEINTQSAAPLAAGFSGFNVPQPRNGVEYYDPKFMAAVTPLKPGWVRYPGGTSSMAFDWTTGHINSVWLNSLVTGNPAPVTAHSASILTISRQLTQAKGGVAFSDFATFANTLEASAIICFNSFTDNTPDSATRMALAAQGYGLNVLEWELGNEAYIYPLIFPTAWAYIGSSHSYYHDITMGAPAATAGLFAAGLYPPQPVNFSAWDNGLASYTPPYWNAVSSHIYPIISTQTNENTMLLLNGLMAHGSSEYVNSYLVPLAGANTPIFVTELNCCAGYANPFLTYLYNGIFLAEYIARLSSVPNVKGVGVNSLYTDNDDYHGLIQSVNDFESYLLGQLAANPNYSTDTATNPETQFQFYTSAPGLAVEVANQAINSSTELWPTTVTGGNQVAIAGFDGIPIPAVYAQAYLAKNGNYYLLVTNKSAFPGKATIQVNGIPVQGALHMTYVSNSNPWAVNTAQSPTNIRIQTTTSSSPIQLAPYSVTTVTWQ